MAAVETTEIKRVVTEPGFVLTLNRDEVETLAVVLAKVGGSTTNSPRKYAEEMLRALQRAGISWEDVDAYQCLKGWTGIQFNDFDEN